MLSRLFAQTGKAVTRYPARAALTRDFSGKLGIGDALTILEDKISNISQIVTNALS